MMTLILLTISAVKLDPLTQMRVNVPDLLNRNIPENQQEAIHGGYGWINTNMQQTVMGAKKKNRKMNILKKIVSDLQDTGGRENSFGHFAGWHENLRMEIFR